MPSPSKVEFKVGLFVIITFLLVAGFLTYFAYRKDVFTKINTFTLISRTGDDLAEGMPVMFSGFNIGRIHSLELSEEGMVIIKIRVPERHVKWLRANSTFIVDKPLIGSPKMLVSNPEEPGPPLAATSRPEVTRVNNLAEIAKQVQPILERAKNIVANLEEISMQISSPEGDINKILGHSERLAAKLAQKNSLLEVLIHDREAVEAIHDSLRRTRDLTLRMDQILTRVDGMAKKTDEGIYGQDGLLPLTNKILKETLTKLDLVAVSLENINKITADVAGSTHNLKRLRADLDAAAASLNDLVTEINRKIPFRKRPEIKLP
jgi:phospholipid/cholesterol/gamma-HCH transport system substrate-binding protein